MQTEPYLEPDVYPVSAWKRGIDQGSPWWKQWYFDWVYMPFVRFSFKYFHVPAPKQAEVEARVETLPDGVITTITTTTFSWFEDQGIFDSPERAEAACLEPSWGYKPMPLNRLLPRESVKYGGKIYPRADKPLRHAYPNYELVPIPRRLLTKISTEIREEVQRTNRVLGT